MTTSTIHFVHLSQQKCLEVYPVVKANAERHVRIAKILAESAEYSNAVAHLILGTEELIKTLALFMEGKGFIISTVTDYRKLFYNHSARHSLLKEFFSVWIFCKGLLELKKRKKDEHSFVYGLKIVIEILGAGLEGIANYDWWDEADRLKQNGFYVDYKNGIVSPEVIEISAYEKALKITAQFHQDADRLIAQLSVAGENELKELRSNFEKADIKSLLAESISRSQQKK